MAPGRKSFLPKTKATDLLKAQTATATAGIRMCHHEPAVTHCLSAREQQLRPFVLVCSLSTWTDQACVLSRSAWQCSVSYQLNVLSSGWQNIGMKAKTRLRTQTLFLHVAEPIAGMDGSIPAILENEKPGTCNCGFGYRKTWNCPAVGLLLHISVCQRSTTAATGQTLLSHHCKNYKNKLHESQ